uniref:Uncharacterized protein n=1 Tax=Anopheles epiroticus TaxID=199890 RepID=A0A182PMG8_9DIPT
MSDTNLLQLSAAWRQLPHLVTPFDRELSNSFRTWAPSWQTQQLASETSRKLFVELVIFEGVNQCRPFDALARPVPNKSEHEECNLPPSLSAIVVQFLVSNFNDGPEPDALSCCQVRVFGALLSTELPLLKVINLESETYWRRVVWRYEDEPLAYYEHHYLTPRRFWKQHGVELKLARMIEQQEPEYWELEGLEETIKKAAPFVNNLCVQQLRPYKKLEPLEDYESYTIRNAPADLCHHGSLAILGHLVNLTSLSLVFGVKHWTKAYHTRYSNCSQTDIENLGLGLQKLVRLKKLHLSHTRLYAAKLNTLLESLTPLELETIRLTHCHLAEGCGGTLGRFLSRFGPTLNQLDLSNNLLDATELDRFCPGLSVYQGTLDKLNLSFNPIGEAGVLILGGAIKGRAQLSELNFTGCPLGVEGSFRVIQLLSFHETLRKVRLDCVPISPEGGEKLVQVLLENTRIEDVQVRECGLSAKTLARIRRALRKNAKERYRSQRRSVFKMEDAAKTAARSTVRSPADMFQLERQVFMVPS